MALLPRLRRFAIALSGSADVADDLLQTSLEKAIRSARAFDGADLSADEKNQSMGLMRGAFKSANLDGASFKGANMARVFLEFASLKGADLTGANLRGSELAAADFTGADVTGVNFDGADVNSARIGGMKNLSAAKNFDKVKNLERARRD